MHSRPFVFLGFPASKAAELGGTPRKHLNRRFCNTRSFSGGHFQGPSYFLDFRLPRPPKWGEPHQRRPPKCGELQYSLLFRKPFPRLSLSLSLSLSFFPRTSSPLEENRTATRSEPARRSEPAQSLNSQCPKPSDEACSWPVLGAQRTASPVSVCCCRLSDPSHVCVVRASIRQSKTRTVSNWGRRCPAGKPAWRRRSWRLPVTTVDGCRCTGTGERCLLIVASRRRNIVCLRQMGESPSLHFLTFYTLVSWFWLRSGTPS